MDIDLRILELLSSKICHDLVSPVGAINNGVELIEDIGGDVVDEAMKLISNSAEQASRRLRLFRMAYGRAGSEAAISFKDTRETIEAFVAGSKTRLSFAPDFPPGGLVETPGALKVLVNLVLLADETLVYGGDILVENATGAFLGGAALKASGRNAALTELSAAAFHGTAEAEAITARTVHAYVTGKFVSAFDFKAAVETTENETVTLSFARA